MNLPGPRPFAVGDDVFASLNLTPRAEPALIELGLRLGNYEQAVEPTEEASGQLGPFASYEDFKARGLVRVDRPVRSYLPGGRVPRLVVPESYAASLDGLRALKLNLAGSSFSGPGDCQDCPADLRAQLAAHELRGRLLPEEVLTYLDELPNRNYFTRIWLVDMANPEDLWAAQTYQANFVSAMATQPTGDVLLFRTERNEFVRMNLHHEWSHRLQQKFAEIAKIFEDAIELGWRNYRPHGYALRSYGEHWAVFGEELLHPDASRFLTLAERAPIRTTLWMLALKDALESQTECERGIWHAGYLSRTRFAFDNALPLARAALEEVKATGGSGPLADMQRSEDPQARERAQRVLAFLDKQLPPAATEAAGRASDPPESITPPPAPEPSTPTGAS